MTLSGKTVVITRPQVQSSFLKESIEARGAKVIVFPCIEIIPLPLTPESQRHLTQGAFDWVVFTSANGVHTTLAACQGEVEARFSHMKIAAVGPQTAETLGDYGLKADLLPPQHRAESLFQALQEALLDLSGQRFLIPQAALARPDLADLLSRAGAEVRVVPMYQTVFVEEDAGLETMLEALRHHGIDIITFTSASTVLGFQRRLRDFPTERKGLQERSLFASIGPMTSKMLRKVYGKVDIEAAVHTTPGLIEGIETFLSCNQPLHL